jgi:tripartite-type tricarboxylate transporter receptor subunit TctC
MPVTSDKAGRGGIMSALRIALVSALLACFAFQNPARAADDFAERRITLLVPFAAGGTLDILARLLGEKLSDTFGPRVIVENRPGAGGIIASRQLVGAEPDGHTLLLVAGGHALNPLMYAKLPYDTLKDFAPVSLLAGAGNVILVPPNSPYKTLGEILAAARKDPGSITYGTAGVGTSVHVSGELLKHQTGADLTAVHFKGDSDSLAAVMGSHIPMSINAAPAAIAQIKQGSVRALAVTSAVRSSFLPDVPTVAESGVAGYDVVNWWGVVAPGKTPPETVARLNAAIQKAMKELAGTDRLKELSIDVISGSPEDFDRLIRSEMQKWGPVVKAAGIELDAK